jgi:putative Mg2+ transporter-C (MgtC) family protein
MSESIPWLPMVARLLMSILCGAAIGIEREWARKGAGLRTMILICMGATLYMSASQLLGLKSGATYDISRVASQIVVGVGFIGGGAIIVGRGRVQGLTTAATIWVTAAIGLIIGVGYPFFGLLVTLIVLAILVLLRVVEQRFIPHRAVKPDITEDEDGEPR